MSTLQPPKISCSRESFQELSLFIDGSVPFVDMIVGHGSLEADSQRILSHVFPKWFADGNHLVMTQCKDGITNKRKSRRCYSQ